MEMGICKAQESKRGLNKTKFIQTVIWSFRVALKEFLRLLEGLELCEELAWEKAQEKGLTWRVQGTYFIDKVYEVFDA